MVVCRLDEHPVVGKPLGRHIEHDPRSRTFPFLSTPVAAPPLRTVRWRRYGGVFDQGDLGSCTGNAGCGAMNTLPLHHAGEHLYREADAIELYSEATRLDPYDGEYPPDDTGSSGLAIAKALRARGLITEYRHAFSIDEAVSALMSGPVITGVSWYEGFDHPDVRGRVAIAGQVRGGHEFLAHGYELRPDPLDSLVHCDNSWGNSWGVRGHFTMTARTWGELLDEQGDVTILVR